MPQNFITRQLSRLPGRVLKNATSLYAVQFAQYALPFISVPYLARVIKPDAWGLILMCQSFGVWLSYISEYGFGFSATRGIARVRDDSQAIKRIVSNTLCASGLLSCVTLVIAFGATLFVPTFRDKPGYLWLAWAGAVLQGCTPLWYFQGIEKMTTPAIITLGTRAAGLVAILLFVRTPADAWKVLAIYAVTALIGLIWCLILVERWIGLQLPEPGGSLRTLREGWHMFVVRSAASIFTTANAFILGIFAPAKEVAFYGGAERLPSALLTLLTPFTQAFYPYMSHLMRDSYQNARRLAIFMLMGVMGASFVACGVLQVFAPWVIWLLYGGAYAPAVPVLRVLSLIIPALALQNVLGVQWMLPKGLDVEFTRIVIAGTFIDVVLAIALTPHYGAIGMSIAVTTSNIVVSSLILLICASERGGYFERPASGGLRAAALGLARRLWAWRVVPSPVDNE